MWNFCLVLASSRIAKGSLPQFDRQPGRLELALDGPIAITVRMSVSDPMRTLQYTNFLQSDYDLLSKFIIPIIPTS